ncbi:MAG: Na(+)-translocating NADH-quinone reductase subunit A [Candidatus Hydrogenedentes bacterium]|nr:Na(+)-translocating NADH-quinone reductase subunit A [Candidatus Hydrogenedentota bacterium]
MAEYTIQKGLDIPIDGEPETEFSDKIVRHVAIVASDYVGMKPRMKVQAGHAVKRGTPLFEDKKAPGVCFTAPGAGTVIAVNRGERRALQSVVIELNESELSGTPSDDDFLTFAAYTNKAPDEYTREEVVALLVEAGLWPAFRTRPFSKTPLLDSIPHSIFITASDSNPLAPSMDVVLDGRQDALDAGVRIVAKLTGGKVFFCKKSSEKLAPASLPANVSIETFAGPHPSGTVGLHIGRLDPVSTKRTVWHIGLQDLLSVGALVLTGKLDVSRVLSFAGPGVSKPRMIRTRLGASIDAIGDKELTAGENRVLSGSILNGCIAMGDALGYLGRFHNQITVLSEGREREFMGWLAPGREKFSLSRLFLSILTPGKKFKFTTTTNGSPRAIVPIGLYEQVMPLDILPTFLLRSLASDDMEQAEKLGCLELDEEDLALCSFVDPGKTDFGPLLRRNLELIEREG